MDPASITVPNAAYKQLIVLGKKLWGLFMSPTVLFGSPNIQLSSREPKNTTWWYVPVYIKPAWLSKTLPDATAHLIGLRGDSSPDIDLRWYSRDSDCGASEVTMAKGRQYLIPLAHRIEGEEFAHITNENWLRKKEPVKKWPLDEGEYLFWLEVRARGEKHRSRYMYKLNIPKNGESNGRFILSVHYGNVY